MHDEVNCMKPTNCSNHSVSGTLSPQHVLINNYCTLCLDRAVLYKTRSVKGLRALFWVRYLSIIFENIAQITHNSWLLKDRMTGREGA